jgi:hypothetical protein
MILPPDTEELARLVSSVTGEPEVDVEVDVVAVSSGAKTLSHEASIIAAKERAEMKMIEFFIPRKLSLTAQ